MLTSGAGYLAISAGEQACGMHVQAPGMERVDKVLSLVFLASVSQDQDIVPIEAQYEQPSR